MKKVINTAGVDRTAMCFQWLTGQGVAAWSSITSYVKGDMAQTADNKLWRCIVPNINEEPGTAGSPPGTYWLSVDEHGERNVVMRDFYFIGPPVYYPSLGSGSGPLDSNYGAYPLVDSDAPISYQPYEEIPNQGHVPVITFVPFSIEKDKLEYKTGFEASTLNLTLRPRDPNPKTTPVANVSPYLFRGIATGGGYDSATFAEGILTKAPYSDMYTHVGPVLYQTMRQSFAQSQEWYLAPVTVWRTFSPAEDPSDVTSYGAAVMFRGRISSIQVDAEDVKIAVASLMEIFKQKVPSQTIQPGNRWAPFNFQATEDFFGSVNPVTIGGFNYVRLQIPTPIADGDLAEGFALVGAFYSASLAGSWWRHVLTNVGTTFDGTYYHTTVVFLENLPIDLTTLGDVEARLWKSSDTATNPSGPGSGFPYVPQPLTGIA
jgi:hypothetical protein